MGEDKMIYIYIENTYIYINTSVISLPCVVEFYDHLTATSLDSWPGMETIPKMPYLRLVIYCEIIIYVYTYNIYI